MTDPRASILRFMRGLAGAPLSPADLERANLLLDELGAAGGGGQTPRKRLSLRDGAPRGRTGPIDADPLPKPRGLK